MKVSNLAARASDFEGFQEAGPPKERVDHINPALPLIRNIP